MANDTSPVSEPDDDWFAVLTGRNGLVAVHGPFDSFDDAADYCESITNQDLPDGLWPIGFDVLTATAVLRTDPVV